MAANAPYYQIRGQSFPPAGTSASNGHVQFATGASAVDEDEYDLASALPNHNAPTLYADGSSHAMLDGGLEENHNFVELLEAATTAAGQAAAGATHVDGGREEQPAVTQYKGKRKRLSSPVVDDGTNGHPGAEQRHKRAKRGGGAGAGGGVNMDPQLPGSHEDVLPSSEGVHSAAALFRRASNNQTAKKYTRPPMSKLFISLQLTPENFIHLQTQAKVYMLDPAHPERQNCVGNRGKGDTDMVKLRLFNCVRDFLNDGAGDQFFGEGVEKPGEKEATEAARALGEDKAPSNEKLAWPRDGNKIISLVTPLLRRMVTNERQRMYAIETRKGGPKRKEGSADAPNGDASRKESRIGSHDLEQMAPFDPSLGQSLNASTAVSYHTPSAASPSTPLAPTALRLRSPQANPQPLIALEDRAHGKARKPLPTQVAPHLERFHISISWKGMPLDHRSGPIMECHGYTQLLTTAGLTLQNTCQQYAGLRKHERLSGPSAAAPWAPEALQGLAAAATKMGDDVGRPTSPRHHSMDREPGSIDAARLPDADVSLSDTITTSPEPHIPPTSVQSVFGSSALGSTCEKKVPDALLKSDLPDFRISALCRDGLKEVTDDGVWEQIKDHVSTQPWAAGEVRLLVEVE